MDVFPFFSNKRHIPMIKLVNAPLSQINSNPFRDFTENPLIPSKVENLKASIKETDYWPNIIAREINDHYEIAYGHHRLEALKQLYPLDYQIHLIVKPMSDMDMLQIMGNENSDDWGNVAAHACMLIQQLNLLWKKEIFEKYPTRKKFKTALEEDDVDFFKVKGERTAVAAYREVKDKILTWLGGNQKSAPGNYAKWIKHGFGRDTVLAIFPNISRHTVTSLIPVLEQEENTERPFHPEWKNVATSPTTLNKVMHAVTETPTPITLEQQEEIIHIIEGELIENPNKSVKISLVEKHLPKETAVRPKKLTPPKVKKPEKDDELADFYSGEEEEDIERDNVFSQQEMDDEIARIQEQFEMNYMLAPEHIKMNVEKLYEIKTCSCKLKHLLKWVISGLEGQPVTGLVNFYGSKLMTDEFKAISWHHLRDNLLPVIDDYCNRVE